LTDVCFFVTVTRNDVIQVLTQDNIFFTSYDIAIRHVQFCTHKIYQSK